MIYFVLERCKSDYDMQEVIAFFYLLKLEKERIK
jgi:hypothetical protein